MDEQCKKKKKLSTQTEETSERTNKHKESK